MRSRTRLAALGTGLVLTAALVPALPALASAAAPGPSVLLRAPLVGSLASDPTLFGVVPGTKDWSPGRSRVTVRSDGRLDARVRDLVLTGEGSNPLPLVSASLVCGGVVVSRVLPVPFSTSGGARLRGRFTVPARCLAPAVLLNPLDRDGVYIAATGGMATG